MRPERRREIDRFADAVRAYAGLGGPPYDVDGLVAQLGGRLEKREGMEAFFHEASVSKDGPTSFVIKLGSVTSENRRRFNVAHELGHLFLHMGYRVDWEKWSSVSSFDEMNRSGTSEEEYEAHQFAGALLMPESEFREVASQNLRGATYNVAAIADYFGVSVQAASTRGRWLGMFAWS